VIFRPSNFAGSVHQHTDPFVEEALDYAQQNASGRATVTFGPVTVRIQVCGATLSSIALDPLRHAATKSELAADMLLVMIDARDTGLAGPVLDRFSPSHDGQEQSASVSSRRSTLTFNEEWKTRCLIDADRRQAIIWIADAASIPEWVIYDQIRNALHWLSYGRNFGLFHAAALQRGGVGCLITGKSGSGKSTITAAAIGHGFNSAGDDFLLIETGAVPRVHAIFDTIKLDDQSLARFPQFRPFIRNPARRLEEKAIVHLFDSDRDRIASGFELQVLLHAHLTGERNSRIVHSTPSDAYRALAPSTLLLLRTQGQRVSQNCVTLASRLGTYAFEIGIDVDHAVNELARFMDGLKR
jgi:hypothetical protein